MGGAEDDDPMLGQYCVVPAPPLADVPDEVVPEIVDDVVVVAAKDANPYAMKAPIAKIATTAMRSRDFLDGKDFPLGTDVVPISISSLHLRQ